MIGYFFRLEEGLQTSLWFELRDRISVAPVKENFARHTLKVSANAKYFILMRREYKVQVEYGLTAGVT